MAKDLAEIDYSEWLAELERVTQRNEIDGFTSRDFKRVTGLSDGAAGDRLRAMVNAGVIEFIGKTLRATIAGGKTLVPVYRRAKKLRAAKSTNRKERLRGK